MTNNKVFLGQKATTLSWVTMTDHCIVGTERIVAHDLPSKEYMLGDQLNVSAQ